MQPFQSNEKNKNKQDVLRGKFITFEGIDGSGKTRQLRMLVDKLRVRGFDVATTMEPGGTPLGQRLRRTFLETEETIAPLAELLLFAADRARHVEFLIKPALADGKIIISDRYADATFAYRNLLYGKNILDTVSVCVSIFTVGASRVYILFNFTTF
ncbi:MAG TPA: dTMP kinase [Pyrinomonadaceae bacterium]|nr:dTMP kinase [Pyrinomonadaceae bacterium]